MLQILEFYLQCVVVIAHYHIVFLRNFSSVSELLILVLQSSHLKLVLLDYLVERNLDLSIIVACIDFDLLLNLRKTEWLA